MFGLLKKNDFDSQNTLIQSKIAELSTVFNNVHNTNITIINNNIRNLANDVNLISIQLKEIQNSFNELQKNILNSNFSNNINTDIDFNKLISHIKNLYRDKHSLKDSDRRILEDSLEASIRNHLSQENMYLTSERFYPDLSGSNGVLSKNPMFKKDLKADILLLDKLSNITTIIELKRWDCQLESNGDAKAQTKGDRSKHYFDITKLAWSKKINPKIKHYFISVYECYTSDVHPKGYVYVKGNRQQNAYASFGPFNSANKNSIGENLDFSEIDDLLFNKPKIDDIFKNCDESIKDDISDQFNNMYNNTNSMFQFKYIDYDKIKSNNPFSNITLKLICDEQINNTNLSQSELQNLSLQEIIDLPSNWRVRILEVL